MNAGDRLHGCGAAAGHEAAPVLVENLHLLPRSGIALDLACGRGANALLLAEAGLKVLAWDRSAEELARLRNAAAARGLAIEAERRDVVARPPCADSVDVIVVSRFLDRSLMPALQAALRRGGLIYYQTFIDAAVSDRGPRNPDYRLRDNELLTLLPDLRLVVYREEGLIGDTSQGFRDQAMLVARRP